MSKFASGKHAVGYCDRCAWEYPLRELRGETNNLNKQNIKVCPECWDKDHPQNKLGRLNFADNQALRDPRPDSGIVASRLGDVKGWEFTDSVDGWLFRASSSPETTLTHDETNGLAVLEWDGTGADTYIYNDTIYSDLIDASDYNQISIRYRESDIVGYNGIDYPNASHTWFGWLLWSSAPVGPFDFDTSHRRKLFGIPAIPMGDRWVEVDIDMSDVSTWGGVLDTLRFDFYDASSTSGKIEIDWIRLSRKHGIDPLRIEYAFDSESEMNLWTPLGSSTLTYVTYGGIARHSWVNQIDPQMHLTTDVSIDASVYTQVRMRLVINDRSTLTDTWVAEFFWSRSTDSGFSGDRRKTTPEPTYINTDDQWVEVLWDMSSVDLWSGTVDGIRFDMWAGVSGADSGSVDIDWIRIEEKL